MVDFQKPPKCSWADCPQCKNQGAKDPSQIELIRELPVEFNETAFETENDPGDENGKPQVSEKDSYFKGGDE